MLVQGVICVLVAVVTMTCFALPKPAGSEELASQGRQAGRLSLWNREQKAAVWERQQEGCGMESEP